MQRRTFLKNASMAGAGTIPAVTAFSNPNTMTESGKPFNMNYAFHDGMFSAHGGNNFIDQIKFAHGQGFRSIEDNGMMGRTPQMQSQIGETLAKLGMQMGVFVVSSNGWHWEKSLATGKQEFKDLIVKDCKQAVEVAKRTNAKWMTVVPGNFDRSLPMDVQTANVIDGLRRGSEILEKHGLVMVLEPLSDNPDLFLRFSTQTYMICKAVNSSACKILFDMYHMQRNEGNIMNNIDLCWDEIGYFQIGDNPGRNEPTTGEMNYKNLFKHIYKKGFKGILGMEHGNSLPGKEGELALIKAYRDSDAFL